jgi:hypothetical protein
LEAYYNRALVYKEIGDINKAESDARAACHFGDCDVLEQLKEEKLINK